MTGIGPIRTGQSSADVAEALRGAIESHQELESCDYIAPPGWPSGVLVMQVQPHKYTAGRYLIVAPAGTESDDHRFVFETDGEKVERYRAGVLPAVEWVEGCG